MTRDPVAKEQGLRMEPYDASVAVAERVDPSQSEETAPAALNETNARFGRRFRIVAFRWLGADEI